MVDLVSVIQWVLYAFILGIIAPLGFIKYKRGHYKGKVLCTFHLKNRKKIHVFLQPNDLDLLDFRGGYYLYNEEYVTLSGHWLAGDVPSLDYIENIPLPTNLKGYTSENINISAKQIATDFQDSAMQAFAEATDINIKESVTQQIRKDFMIMFLALVGLVAIGGYILFNEIQKLGDLQLPT